MRGRYNFITGAIVLGAAGIIARFLGVFFRWPVTMLIGDEGIGIYQLVYPIYMFMIGIMSGFPIAISRMVSEKMALGRRYQAYRVFKYSLLVLGFIGFISSILLYIFCPYIIKGLKWRSEVYYSFVAISFAPLFVSIMSSFRGYFQGLQMMAMPAASQIAEQLGRVIVGVGLTYLLLPFGVSYSAAGASFGACAGAILGCILLIFGFIRDRKYTIPDKTAEKPGDGGKIAMELLMTAVPISLGMTVGSIMSLIDSIVVPGQLLSAGFSQKTATELYGQLTGKAHTLINVPLAFSTALGTSLVPAISEAKAGRRTGIIKNRTESAFKLSVLLGLPSSAGLFILADPVMRLVFPGKSAGGPVLQVLSIGIVFIVIAQVLTSVLQGIGNVMSPVKNLLIGAIIKLLLSYTLTAMPRLNIEGAAIASIVGYIIAGILDLKDVRMATGCSIDVGKMVLSPLLAALVMGIGVSMMYNMCMGYTGSNGLSTIVSVIVGIIIYGILILLLGCLTSGEISAIIKRKPGNRKGKEHGNDKIGWPWPRVLR